MGVIVPAASHAQDFLDFTIAKTPYRISLAAATGVLIGQSEEIVYLNANNGIKLSQLLWDLKPMIYAGSFLSFSRANLLAGLGATMDMSVKFGLPLQSGTMEDRDWQNLNDPKELTDFSTHDAYLEGMPLLLDLSLGISYPIQSMVAVRALFAISYMHFSWSGKDGYGTYKHLGWKKEPFNGTVITYEQAWLIFSPGIGFFLPFHRAWSLDFRFFIGPFVYAGAEDHHRTTGGKFNDYMREGLCLEPSLDITFSPNWFFSLVAHGSFRQITGTRGDTSENDSIQLKTNLAGAGYSAFDVGLFFKFALPLGLIRARR